MLWLLLAGCWFALSFFTLAVLAVLGHASKAAEDEAASYARLLLADRPPVAEPPAAPAPAST